MYPTVTQVTSSLILGTQVRITISLPYIHMYTIRPYDHRLRDENTGRREEERDDEERKKEHFLN